MSILYKSLVLLIMLNGFVFGFEIDKFDAKDSLTQNFSTNCLQMTQSQQILKAYVMVGLNSTYKNPKENLKRAIVDYDTRAYQVKEYFLKLLKPDDTKAKESFDKAIELWTKNKDMLEKTPTKENALKIRRNFLDMINFLLAGTKPLATPDLELISLTGKLCRKPMEITIDYLLKIWGVDMPDYQEDVKKIIKNFHKDLELLSANKLNNKESLKLLQKSKKQFKFFEFMLNSKSRFVPTLLSKKADDNFIIIRDIKKIYKSEAAKK